MQELQYRIYFTAIFDVPWPVFQVFVYIGQIVTKITTGSSVSRFNGRGLRPYASPG